MYSVANLPCAVPTRTVVKSSGVIDAFCDESRLYHLHLTQKLCSPVHKTILCLEKMEQLQILKIRFLSRAPQFTEGLMCTEQEVCILDLDTKIIKGIYDRGEIEKLDKYIADSSAGWGG
jgi:hypothetical protein